MSLESFISIVEGETGYVEGANNDTKYGDWYGLPNQSWCAMFISWCADQAGILTTQATDNLPKIPRSSTVTQLRTFYAANRRDLAPSANEYSPNYPKPGDLAVIANSGGEYAHVGVVVETDGNKITTVEGNISDQVKRVIYTDLEASGYGRISLILSNTTSY